MYDDSVKKRLRRIEGQVRGVLSMMERGDSCKDVVSQLSAVRSAVDKSIAYIVAMNLEHCLTEQERDGEDRQRSKLVQEAVDLLMRSR